MKLKTAFILCIGAIIISAAGCADNTNQTEPASQTGESVPVIAFDTESTEISEERLGLSESKFLEMAETQYDLSETEAKAMYQKIEDSKILDKENICITGAVLNDYDGNGKTDMLVCLYEDKENADIYTDGCLYLFMNDDKEPYYIYDDFCCYGFGEIFGDFGADIDHDGNTEIVFCVQGTGCGGTGDCQKFVLKYKDNKIIRMELPNDFPPDCDYDSGLCVNVERDSENGVYKVSCPYLDETVLVNIAEDDKEDQGGGENSRGYYMFEMLERGGKQLFAGYEYLYAGCIANGIGSAVFLFDWDENGKVFVSDWYVEDWDDNIYVPYDRIQKNETDTGALFGADETGAEAAAYEEFLTGKRNACVSNKIYADTSYIGKSLTDKTEEENSFSLNDLIMEITDEMAQARGSDCHIERMEYALIDCGNDGKKQLALRAYGLGIYSENDDSDLTMVFDFNDGTLSMVYAVDSWARSDNELFKNGYVSGGGSGGAASHYVWEGIIKADGTYHKSYDCHTETGQGLYEMSSCWEVWDENDSDGFPAEFGEYWINGDTIYSYYILEDTTDAEKKIIMDYIKDNESRLGIRFLTSDEAWARVEKNRSALGITEGMDAEENRISWRTLSTAK